MTKPYFEAFEGRKPPVFPPMSRAALGWWHFLAGAAIAAALWYMLWRWSYSINRDTLVFSLIVAVAETLFFCGTLLFYHDIWAEGDTPTRTPPTSRAGLGLFDDGGAISVDIFFTSFDEDVDTVSPSIAAAQALTVPPNTHVQIHLLDDGNRAQFENLAQRWGVKYITRTNNIGFKAGNLRNALFRTSGDFVVICDADTRLFPSFLENTLGYFHEPKVAWVQTPHWFYDIPEGRTWAVWLTARLGRAPRFMAPLLKFLTGQDKVGRDPFISDPAVFFDIIQRRRNRNGASFCCGAASIHRREAIFDHAMKRKLIDARALMQKFATSDLRASTNCITLEPYRFHVSEDIYTSIELHSDAAAGWTSVYHPQVEARMLSPWSAKAWATQRLKYAGGTFDIMLRDNPLVRRGMSWRTKLHYASTFWSYLTALWMPVLLMAPAFSLVTGMAPVKAYSADFFLHFLPMILLGEMAMLATSKGHSIGTGRMLAIATLHIQLRALWLVLRGRRPTFTPTPKTPLIGGALRCILPNIVVLVVLVMSGLIGVVLTLTGAPDHSTSLLMVNLFWLSWNIFLVARITFAATWQPHGWAPPTSQAKPAVETPDVQFQTAP